MSREHMRRLLECLASVHRDGGIDCDTAASHFTRLCEQALNGADIHSILPQAAAHIAHCPDCREEYEALLAVLRAGQANDSRTQT